MGDILASASLFAPLAVASFALAYAILIGIPGYALASLARPAAPRTERLALAIPCAYSLVAVIGLGTALLHLPFDLRSYSAVALPIVLIGGYRAWRDSRRQGRGNYWQLAPFGVALAQLVAIALVYARYVVPSGSDTVSHTAWTAMLARTHIFPIALMSSHAGANDGGFYPPVFHAVTALVIDAVPIPAYHAVFMSVLATIVFLPCAMFCYVRKATGSDRLGALAALSSLAFEPLPFFVLAQGLYTFTASLLFTPVLAMTLCDGLGHRDRRAVALSALLGIGLFYTHPTEFITAALLTLAIVSSPLLKNRTAGAWLRVCAYSAIIGGIWFAAAFPALLAVRRTMVNGAQAEIKATHDFSRPAHVDLPGALDGYLQWVYGHNLSLLLLGLTLVGVIWCLMRRRYLGLVAVQAILFLLFIDSVSYNVLQRFYTLSFPWALWERLAATHYWFTLPLAGIGLDVVARLLGRVRWRKKAPFTAIAFSPFVILGCVLPFGLSAMQAAAYSGARQVVAPQDLGAVAWLAHHGDARSVVVNDADMASAGTFDAPVDAGLWMSAMDAPVPLFGRSAGGPGPLEDRLYVLQHVADNPLPLRAERYMRQYGVRYIFYGAAIRPSGKRHLNLRRLLADPHLDLSYTSSATCRDVDGRMLGLCPTTASYVFTLVPQTSQTAVAQNSHVRVAAGRLSSR